MAALGPVPRSRSLWSTTIQGGRGVRVDAAAARVLTGDTPPHTHTHTLKNVKRWSNLSKCKKERVACFALFWTSEGPEGPRLGVGGWGGTAGGAAEPATCTTTWTIPAGNSWTVLCKLLKTFTSFPKAVAERARTHTRTHRKETKTPAGHSHFGCSK